LSDAIMKEDLSSILGTDKFDVRYSSSSNNHIDISMKEFGVDIEAKLSVDSKKPAQDIHFHRNARENKRLFVYVTGDSPPEFHDYRQNGLTKAQRQKLASMTERIKAKLARVTRGRGPSEGSGGEGGGESGVEGRAGAAEGR